MASPFFCFIVLCTITVWSTPGQGRIIETGVALRGHDPQYVVAPRNSKLLLNCSVVTDQQHGPLEYTWKKDGITLNLDRRVQVIENGSLYFRKVLHRRKRNDEGVYECVVTNKVGSIIARRVKLEVAGINKNYDKQPEPQTAVVGGVARFQCQINASPPPIYTWWKDNRQLIANDRYIIITSGILQILDIQADDQGSFNCMTMPGSLHEYDKVGDFNFKKSSEASLTVTSDNINRPPKFVATPANITTEIGHSVIFECLADGNPKPTITWTRADGLPISNSVLIGGMNLKLMDVKLDDGGIYKCTAESPGHDRIIARASLYIQSQPVIQEGPTSRASPPSMNTRFKCAVAGTPLPKTTWLKDGKVIGPGATYRIIKNELVVRGATPDDSGYYQCVVKNDVGYATAFARYLVEGKAGAPSPPKRLQVQPLSSTEAYIEWEEAEFEACCPVIAYTMEIQEINNPSEVQTEVVMRSSNSKHIRHLRPYTNYSIFLIAFSQERGPSSKSETVTFQTLEDVPKVAPLIRLASTTPTSILVEWDEIPERERNGVITGYKIFYKKKNDTATKVETEPGNSRSHLIRGLEPQVTYKVRVLAGTNVGYSVLAETQWPWMEYSTPPVSNALKNVSVPIPPIMHVVVINDTAVEVSWQQTDTRFHVASYTLVLKKLMDTNSTQVITVVPPASKYVFSKLKNNTFYEVSLVANNEFGSSTPVLEEFDIPPESGPHTPRGLRVTLSTATSINLEWTLIQSSVSVFYFEMRYHAYSPQTQNPEYKTQKSESTSVLIENLLPYTYYLFEVRAVSTYGAGKFSNSVIERTREDVPSAPRIVSVQPKPRAIIIEWSPPVITHGNITEYVIMYQPDGSSSWRTKSVNGTLTKAVIDGLLENGYFIKLSACTAAGRGPSSEKQQVSLPGATSTGAEGQNRSIFEDQKLGIIVGVTIGVVCIIICILIIMLRNKCFSSSYPHTQPAHFHGNGHIPCHGNGMVRMGNGQNVHEMESYTPMLTVLPENHQLDSKGCGSGNLIVTPNGTRVDGYVPFRNGMRNGHIPNGHVTTFISDPQKSEETRGLLAAMLAASDGSCTSEDPVHMDSRSSNPEQESLDDIEKSVDENQATDPSQDEKNASQISDLPLPPPPPIGAGDIIDKGGGTALHSYRNKMRKAYELQQEFSPTHPSAHDDVSLTVAEHTVPDVSLQTFVNNSSCSNQHSTSTEPSRRCSDGKVSPHHTSGDSGRSHYNLSSQPNNLISGSLPGTRVPHNQCHMAQGDIVDHLSRRGHNHNQNSLPPSVIYPGHRNNVQGAYSGQTNKVQGAPGLGCKTDHHHGLAKGRQDVCHITKSPQDFLHGGNKMCSQGSPDVTV